VEIGESLTWLSIQLARKIVGSSLSRSGSGKRESAAAPATCRHTANASKKPRTGSGAESSAQAFIGATEKHKFML
jgi:uncharacterized protein YgiB involved in biofilm formation